MIQICFVLRQRAPYSLGFGQCHVLRIIRLDDEKSCVSKQIIQLGGVVVVLGSALALLGPGPLRLGARRLGVPGPAALAPVVPPAALVVAARGLAGDRADGGVAGVGVGAAGGHLAAGVVRLVRGDPQLVAVVVLAAAEIQVVAVRVAAHGCQPTGLSPVVVVVVDAAVAVGSGPAERASFSRTSYDNNAR